MSVKLGPISAAFDGSAVIEREDAALRGVIRGAGSDRGTGSRTKRGGLSPRAGGGWRQTRVLLVVEYSLQGALAQFSRSSLAQDLGRRLVADFAANLNARLGSAANRQAQRTAGCGSAAWSWLGDRLRRLFRRWATPSWARLPAPAPARATARLDYFRLEEGLGRSLDVRCRGLLARDRDILAAGQPFGLVALTSPRPPDAARPAPCAGRSS